MHKCTDRALDRRDSRINKMATERGGEKGSRGKKLWRWVKKDREGKRERESKRDKREHEK